MANEKISRYPGIRSFETDERELFFGRAKETQELLNLIKVQRSVVLFAKSGIGKTSLLNAGVIPLLTEDIYYPIKVRFQHTGLSPAEMLRSAVASLAESVWLKKYGEERLQRMVQGREPLLWEHLKSYAFETKLNIIPILILDQFEEFFMHSAAHQQEFAECLADIIYHRTPKTLLSEQASSAAATDDLFDFPDLNLSEEAPNADADWNKPLNWKVVLSLRSDRLSLLDNLSKTIPAILDNRYQLHPLGIEQATEAIKRPSQLQGDYFSTPCFEYDAPTLGIIQTNLSNQNGEIESFQLQIICQHIEHQIIEKIKKDPQTAQDKWLVTQDYLGGNTGIQTILNDYYEQRIAMLGNADEQLVARRLIEESLIVEGARVSLAETILLNRYRIPPALLANLQNTRLVRVENTHLGRAYEVAHDTLVAPILKSYETRHQREQNEKAAKERLIIQQKEEAIRKQAQKKEAEMRRQINRQRRVIIAFVLLGGMMLVAALLAVWQWQVSHQTSKKLEDNNKQLEAQASELQKQQNLLQDSQRQLEGQNKLQDKLLKELGVSNQSLEAKKAALNSQNALLLRQKEALEKAITEKNKLNKIRAVNDGDAFFRAKEYRLALDWYLYAQSLIDDAPIREKIKQAQEALK